MAKSALLTTESVGSFLQTARERIGMTQSDVSHALGSAASYPSHDEIGYARVPPSRLKALATIYNLTKVEEKYLLDLAAQQAYKRVDISTLDQASRRKILGVIYAES